MGLVKVLIVVHSSNPRCGGGTAMSKVSIGDEEYEATDLLAFQQFNLWLYEVVLDAVDR